MPVLAIIGAMLLILLGWLLMRYLSNYLTGSGHLTIFRGFLFPGKPTLYYFAGALLGALVAGSLSAHYLLFWLRTPLIKVALLLSLFPLVAALFGAAFQKISRDLFSQVHAAKVLGLWSFIFVFLVSILSTLTSWRSMLPPGVANSYYELRFSKPAGSAVESENIELVEVKLFSALNGQAQRLPYGACQGNESQGWLGEELVPTDSTQDPHSLVCYFQAQPGDYIEVLLRSSSQQAADIWINEFHYTQTALDGSLRFLPIALPSTAYSTSATIADNTARLAIPGLLLFILFGLAIDRNWLPYPLLGLIVFALASTIVLLRNAWVVEDQFITMRVIENLVHGYGPNFNVGYRVQAFTHPLWMLLLALIYFLANQVFPAGNFLSLYYITALTSLALTTLSFALVFRIGHKKGLPYAFLGACLLLLSKSFVDYSLSGLENPLVNVLLLAFLWQLYLDRRNESSLFWPFFTASCIVITRQDTLLLVLPSSLYLLWKQRHKSQAWTQTVTGLLPIVTWQVFSLVYYGFLVPNTAFAKLNTGIPRIELIEQGLAYFANAARWDLVAILAIVFALLMAAYQRELRQGALGLGILAYLLYIVWIGGDFMSGRFLVAPLVMSAGLLILHSPERRIVLPAMIALAILGLFNERSPLYANLNYGQLKPIETHFDMAQIADERAVFFAQTALLRNSPGQGLAESRWLTWQTSSEFPADVLEMDSIGLSGYSLGPGYVLIDSYALADPLLSKLAADHADGWRIGHFERTTPTGYRQTLFGDGNYLTDPNLAAYWERLQQVIQGNLWSMERFVTIWQLNTGQYQYLLDAYMDTQ